MTHKDKFQCDRQSKYDFTASTINYLNQVCHGDLEVTFNEFDDNGNLVEFDSSNASSTARTDIVMFVNDVAYNIELKERWGKYNSDYYGKEGDKEGWFLNIEKYCNLMNNKDYIPIFANLYPDDKVRIWNLNNIKNLRKLTKNIAITNVVESAVIPQERYDVWNRNSKLIERIKGSPSNGKWKNKGLN